MSFNLEFSKIKKVSQDIFYNSIENKLDFRELVLEIDSFSSVKVKRTTASNPKKVTIFN